MMNSVERALDLAKVGLMKKGTTFIITVAFNLQHIIDPKVERAETDGHSIFYNPDFFMELTPGQRVSLIAHETWHVALMHMFRGRNKNHDKYNRAADYVINLMITESGMEPIPHWLHDTAYRGMSTNQVYDLLDDTPPQYQGGTGKDIIYKQPKTKEEETEIEKKVQATLAKAQMQSAMSNDEPGAVPDEIARQIKKLNEPKLPWDMILNRFMQDQAKNDYSWKRPNKRFMPDFYMPAQYSEALSHLVFAIDTSGSVTDKSLKKMLSEIKYIKDVMKPQRMTILDCDKKIHNIYDVTENDDILDLKFNGGGGTSCYPVMKYCEKHSATALVYFTDLYMAEYNEEISFPLLWIVYNNPKRTKVNVGEITHYDIKGK